MAYHTLEQTQKLKHFSRKMPVVLSCSLKAQHVNILPNDE